MKTVRQYMEEQGEALQAVLAHPMCFKFDATSTAYYIVYYPAGYFPNGVRISRKNGNAKALRALLKVMERHWNENGIHGGQHVSD